MFLKKGINKKVINQCLELDSLINLRNHLQNMPYYSKRFLLPLVI